MENSPIVRRTGGTVRPPARCGRSKAKPHKKRPNGLNGNGFLNHSFQPFWGYGGNRERMVREFNSSLANLCGFYQLPLPVTTSLPFPQNIYQSWQRVAEQVAEIDKGLHCIIIGDKGKRAVLGVVKTFELNGLYYLPVRAYWIWAKSAGHQRIADLVTVIFAYLHQVAEIPFYAENGSFMDSQYVTLEQWISETGDEGQNDVQEKEWREERENTLYELRQAGCHILRLIQNPDNLNRMEQVITDYHHQDNGELEWELLGMEFLQLYHQYPKRKLADSIRTDLVHPSEEERIACWQYTGFYWSGKDCFADELDDMINCSFQEMPVMDEPTHLHCFDTLPEPGQKEFDFESRFFSLMDRLRDLLNQYDHEER
jgi:hypothetical protein